MTPRRVLCLFLGVLTTVRLFLVGAVELSPDETYYYQWSRHMDFSYYSKGPGVAAAIWIGTHLFGANEFGVRVLSPLLSLGTSLLMFSFARRLYDEWTAIWTVLTLSLVPMFEIGGLVMTIDPLSMFFWMAALYTSWMALERSAEGGGGWWAATGAMIGLGFLCKWTNAMQLLSVVLLLAFTPRHRRQFLRPGFWAMLAIFLICFTPPLIWNYQHEWVTVHHLTFRGHLEKAVKIRPGEFLKFLGLHFVVYSPLIFGAMLAAIWCGAGRARAHFKPRFLLAFALPLLAMYFWISFRGAGEPNWTAPASLSLGLLTVALFHDAAVQKRWARRYSAAAFAVGLAMCLVVMDTDIVRQFGFRLPYESDPSARVRGWRTMAEIVTDFRKEFETNASQHVFLIADKYQTASELAFYMPNAPIEAPGHPSVYTPESMDLESQYSFWPRYDETKDLGQVARDYLASTAQNGTEPLREEVIKALGELPNEDGPNASKDADPKSVLKTADAKRALVRALRAVAPELPLDESFVQEQGPSLFYGRTALYVTDRPEERAPSSIQRGFERAELVKCIDVKRRGIELRQVRIFACYNYHGVSL